MAIYVRESSTWREIQQPYVKTSGVWREITNQSVKDAGTWRPVFPAQGQLYTWGGNSGYIVMSRLGTNDTTNRCTPVTTFAGGTNWKQVSVSKNLGQGFMAAVKSDGTLWTWGGNLGSELGTNNDTSTRTPVTTFAGGTNWKQVSCGYGHVAAIKTDGTLWVWGRANSTQAYILGLNSQQGKPTPVTTFAGGTNWKQVSCGFNHTAAVKTDGTLWVWGINLQRQLGTNDTIDRCTPVTTFAGGTNWSSVRCGRVYVSAIKADGTLWIWGDNIAGELGTNDTTPRCTPVTTFAGGTNWKQCSIGNSHAAAVKTDGTLWTWGNGGRGALGTNDTTNRCTPVTTFAGGTNWKQVDCDRSYSGAVKTDGTLWTWGYNTSYGYGPIGQLGTNDTTNRCTPVTTFAGGTNWKQFACGGYTSAAIR